MIEDRTHPSAVLHHLKRGFRQWANQFCFPILILSFFYFQVMERHPWPWRLNEMCEWDHRRMYAECICWLELFWKPNKHHEICHHGDLAREQCILVKEQVASSSPGPLLDIPYSQFLRLLGSHCGSLGTHCKKQNKRVSKKNIEMLNHIWMLWYSSSWSCLYPKSLNLYLISFSTLQTSKSI